MSLHDVTYTVALKNGRWVVDRNGLSLLSCARLDRAIRFAAAAAIVVQSSGIMATFRVVDKEESWARSSLLAAPEAEEACAHPFS